MNQDELKLKFPNASSDFIRANSSEGSRPAPKLESNPGYGTLGEGKVQKATRQRFSVRVESVRKRLIDPDNLAEKYALDLCRYSGAIPGDSAAEIDLETTQRKVRKGEDEHTLITITPLTG